MLQLIILQPITDANIATFRAGGYLTKDDVSANTVSVTVDYLEVRYNCN